MSEYIDLRQNDDQIAAMKKIIFDCLKAHDSTESIKFSIEANLYDSNYAQITLNFPHNKSHTPHPTKFTISSGCYKNLNELLKKNMFRIDNRELYPDKPIRILIYITYLK